MHDFWLLAEVHNLPEVTSRLNSKLVRIFASWKYELGHKKQNLLWTKWNEFSPDIALKKYQNIVNVTELYLPL